jgi:hypothetical protein
MGKILFLTITGFLLFLFSSILVTSVSFTGPPRSERQLVFEPGLDRTFSFAIAGANRLETYVTGDLLEYVTLTDPNPGGGARTISINVNLPEDLELEPGKYKFAVGARELADSSGSVGGLTAVQAAIEVFVFREDKYLEYTFLPSDANLNETAFVRFDLHSFTKQKITSAQGFADIYDDSGTKLLSIKSNVVSLASGEMKTAVANYSTVDGFTTSLYIAKGWVVYDGITTSEQESRFKIGDLNVQFISCPEELYAGVINKFPILVKSGWNGEINRVYADVRVGDYTFSTPAISIRKFQEEELLGYLDATEFEPGEYEAVIYVRFGEGKSTLATCSFDLVPPDDDIGGEAEKAKFELSSTHILIIVVIILVIFNIVFFTIFSRRTGKKTPKKKKRK